MDNTPRIDALRLAKSLIGSHGIVFHMNKYNRDMLSHEVRPDSTGIRYDFLLDPQRDSWSDRNPSCSLSISYGSESKGGRMDDAGAMVLDHQRRISISASGNDMDLETFRRRESMVSQLAMLCEMLESSLPQKITTVLETPEEVTDRKQRASEQLTSMNIVRELGESVLRGLRRGGRPRHKHIPDSYASAYGALPATGTYRYRHIKTVDRRGMPREIHYYTLTVYGGASSSPMVSIRRLKEAP